MVVAVDPLVSSNSISAHRVHSYKPIRRIWSDLFFSIFIFILFFPPSAHADTMNLINPSVEFVMSY